MLRVHVELDKYGRGDDVSVLHTVCIANVGGDDEVGFYDVWLEDRPHHRRTTRHTRSDGPLVLAMKAIKEVRQFGARGAV